MEISVGKIVFSVVEKLLKIKVPLKSFVVFKMLDDDIEEERGFFVILYEKLSTLCVGFTVKFVELDVTSLCFV